MHFFLFLLMISANIESIFVEIVNKKPPPLPQQKGGGAHYDYAGTMYGLYVNCVGEKVFYFAFILLVIL